MDMELYSRLPVTSGELLEHYGIESSLTNRARKAQQVVKEKRLPLVQTASGRWTVGVVLHE